MSTTRVVFILSKPIQLFNFYLILFIFLVNIVSVVVIKVLPHTVIQGGILITTLDTRLRAIFTVWL